MGSLLRVTIALIAFAMPGLASAAWHEARSKHFIIYADLRPTEIQRYAERLERYDQAVRRVRGMEDPQLTDAQRLTVYALRNENAIARLAGSAIVRGFYRASASGSAAFVPSRAGSRELSGDLDTGAIFFHEYAHHLQLEATSYAIPPWAVEGFAEFFATAQIEKGGDVLIGAPPQYRGYSLFNGSGLKLEEMVGATYKDLDEGQIDLLYGMGWLLTHYLSFEPSRRGQLTNYIDAIQRGTSAMEAAKAAFGDLQKLDRELNKYMRGRFNGVRVVGNTLAIGDIAVRPLNPGEAAIMDVHIRSRRGVDKKAAAEVVADARRAAAPYPGDPFVQSALAEAEFDAGNYAAAEAAADRVLANNPNYVRGLLYKGRARMEVAQGNAGANWKEIRSWFEKANRADTENAEPLLLFYQSFASAGQPPTKNAIDGLLYAVALVPQDDDVRVNAVRQMLIDNNLKAASQLFAPLAYEPHASQENRTNSAKVMAAIIGGDARKALAELDAALAARNGPAAAR